MSSGYQVDLVALRPAADGIARTIGQVSAHPVASLAGGVGELGHERLAHSIAEFCDCWQAGVTLLVEDGRAAGEHPGAAATAYARTDGAAVRDFDGILRDPGPDPAPR